MCCTAIRLLALKVIALCRLSMRFESSFGSVDRYCCWMLNMSTSAVLPELAFLLKMEVKGVGMVSGDGSGVEGTRERALEVGRQGRGWGISETDIARGVLKIARAI